MLKKSLTDRAALCSEQKSIELKSVASETKESDQSSAQNRSTKPIPIPGVDLVEKKRAGELDYYGSVASSMVAIPKELDGHDLNPEEQDTDFLCGSVPSVRGHASLYEQKDTDKSQGR